MLIGYSMPAVSAVSITDGTWLTADGGAACCDGKPARRARFQWAAGTTLGSYVSIAMTFADATPLRVVAALGLTVPPGVRLEFLGPGGASLSLSDVRTIRMPDGTTGVIALASDDGIADGSCSVRIYNDCNGSPWATGATVVDVGELVAMPAVTIPLREGWSISTVDSSEFTRTRGAQLSAVPSSAYRSLQAQIAGMPTADTRGGGLANGMDLEKLAVALRGGARCLAIPHYRDVSTKVQDAALINRTAIYGYASQIPDAANIQRGYFTGQLVIEEIPAG